MPPYSAEGFEPPAPLAQVLVRAGPGRAGVPVPMLIDTGADTTVVPRAVVLRLEAEIQASGVLLDMFDGTRQEAEVAELRIELLRYAFHGAFVVADAAYGILGRDILNRLVITLDGPRLEWNA